MKRTELPVRPHSGLVKNRRSMAASSRLLSTYLVLVGASLIASALIYRFFPGSRGLMIAEDSLVENCSALFYISTSLLSLLSALSLRSRVGKLYALSCVALLGFLDELSFGERIFSLSMPTLSGKKIDAVHDLVDVAKIQILRHTSGHSEIVVLALGGLAGLFVLALLKWNAEIRIFLVPRLKNISVIFVLLFAVCGLIATLLDLNFDHKEYLVVLEEVLEMDAALCLLFLCFSLKRSAQTAP